MLLSMKFKRWGEGLLQLTLKIGNLFLAACTKKEEFSGTTGKYRKGRNKMGSKRAAVAAAGKKRKERRGEEFERRRRAVKESVGAIPVFLATRFTPLPMQIEPPNSIWS